MKKVLLFTMILAIFFSACASKQGADFDDYNLSDTAWLEKIISHIKDDGLDKADSAYVSLYSEHINSPLLASAMLILSSAHAKNSEYKIANYYIDEYIKLYRNNENYEWLSYLKIKNNFNAFSLPNRNQHLLLKTKKDVEFFLQEFPNSNFKPFVDTIKAKLEITQYLFELEIEKLYKKTGMIEGEKIYKNKITNNDFKSLDYVKPKLPWYRNVFERDYFF